MNTILLKLPYVDKIMVSQKTRPKYYHQSKYKPFNIHGKELLKRFSLPYYEWDSDGYLINKETKERVIANPKKVGKEKYWVVNFQQIYDGYLNYIQRSSYVKKLKDAFVDYIDTLPVIDKFPIQLELFIYAVEMPVDVDNKGVMYFKTITDLMVKQKKIPDDNSQYIIDTGRTRWVKVGHRYKEGMLLRIRHITNDDDIPKIEHVNKKNYE